MGRKRKRRQCREPQAESTPIASEASQPVVPFSGQWLSRFALAFLIILVLIWLFASDEKNRPG